MTGKRLAFAAILSIALAPGFSDTKPEGPAVGMILKTGQEVYIQRAANRTAAKVADLLYAGDRVISTAGSAEFLFCPSSEKMTVQKGTTVALDKEKVQVLKGSAPQKSGIKCALPRVALGAENMEHIGGLRPRGHPPISLYLGGSIYRVRPLIEWGPITGAETYRIIIRNAESNAAVWDTRATSTSIGYPESMSPLEMKEYVLEVRAEANAKTIGEGFSNFVVKPEPGPSKVAGDGTDARLLRAVELENAGYLSEAAAEFRVLRAASPDDKRLTRHLAWLYWNAGLIAASNEEMKLLGPEPSK